MTKLRELFSRIGLHLQGQFVKMIAFLNQCAEQAALGLSITHYAIPAYVGAFVILWAVVPPTNILSAAIFIGLYGDTVYLISVLREASFVVALRVFNRVADWVKNVKGGAAEPSVA